jgi:capsular polysaccharide transport system permease protein
VSETQDRQDRDEADIGAPARPGAGENARASEVSVNIEGRLARRDPVERSERRVMMTERPRALMQLPRQHQPRRIWGRVISLVGVFLALTGTAYFWFVAADRYMVETRFTVQAVQSTVSLPGPNGAPGGIASGAGAAFSDSFMVSEYLQSEAAINDINRSVDLRKMFSSPKADFIERLNPKATPERLARYWSRRLGVDYDPMTDTIVMQAEAFTPDEAFTLSSADMQAADQLVNKVSEEGRRDSLQIAENELHRSQDVLLKATKELSDFQNSKNTIDPANDIQVEQTVITTIQGEIADARSQLAAMTALGTANGPARNAILARIAALEQQLSSEKHTLTQSGTTATGAMTTASVLQEIQHLQVEQDFAKQGYQAALQAYEAAQAFAASKQQYLVTYVAPSMPVQPVRPQRLRMIAICWIVSAIGTAIVSLVYATVREQML